MIVIFSGLPGAGKSLKLADTLLNVMARNRKLYRKAFLQWKKDYAYNLKRGVASEDFEREYPKPQKRILWSNLQLTPKVEKEYAGFFEYWVDLRQLTPLRDVDVAIDEVATYFDARLWETLSLEMRRWLAQHRKFGIEIYGTTQDFAQVDKAFRRLTSDLFLLRKLIGSGDISPTRPAPRYIWGLVVVRELDPTVYDEMKSKFGGGGLLPSFMWISRSMTDIFNTRAEVKMSKSVPLRHLPRSCENPDCGYTKIQHV